MYNLDIRSLSKTSIPNVMFIQKCCSSFFLALEKDSNSHAKYCSGWSLSFWTCCNINERTVLLSKRSREKGVRKENTIWWLIMKTQKNLCYYGKGKKL